MYQVAWHVFEAVVWSLGWLDILNWLKNYLGQAKFLSFNTIQTTSLLQELMFGLGHYVGWTS
jgi:hypothetical protein